MTPITGADLVARDGPRLIDLLRPSEYFRILVEHIVHERSRGWWRAFADHVVATGCLGGLAADDARLVCELTVVDLGQQGPARGILVLRHRAWAARGESSRALNPLAVSRALERIADLASDRTTVPPESALT